PDRRPAAQPSRGKVDRSDPLAVLAYGKSDAPSPSATVDDAAMLDDTLAIRAPMQGTVISIAVAEGDAVRAGEPVIVLSAMKMEHVIEAPASGLVRRIAVAEGDTVDDGQPLVLIEPREVGAVEAEESAGADPAHVRADLAEVERRHALGFDAARAEAVARRRKSGQRTARENVDDLCDPGTFVEYGALAI